MTLVCQNYSGQTSPTKAAPLTWLVYPHKAAELEQGQSEQVLWEVLVWALDFMFGAWVDGLLAERLPTQNTGAFFGGV